MAILFSGSTGDEYEFGTLKQFPHNLVAHESGNCLSLETHSSDIKYQDSNFHNGFSRSNSSNQALGLDSTTLFNSLPYTPAHMEHLFNSKIQAERLLLESTQLQEALCDLKPNANGVVAKQYLRRGTRFGPFAFSEAMEKSNTWDVSI